ncbi:MAG: carbohydrate binding domain-containing protein [Verrucomicrobiota bacterium]
MKKILMGLVLFSGLLLNNVFAATLTTAQWQYPLDSRYVSTLKTAGINSFHMFPDQAVAPSWMSYLEVFDINRQNKNVIIDFYKNHMQMQLSLLGPHYKSWVFRWGWCDAVPYDALTDDNGNPIPRGSLDAYNGSIKWVPELDTVQKYSDFLLENYIKPMIKGRYEQGVYIFVVEGEDYWKLPWFVNNPQYTLSKFFPFHDYHEYEGLSLADKEKRMREVVMLFYKKLYEWKNENYPKVILIHSLAFTHSNEKMLESIRDIPWVDWLAHNGGGSDPIVGTSSNGPEAHVWAPGTGSHYPVFKQMIETNYFEYTNADGVTETRQSRGWGVANTETSWASEAPGTPEQFLKLPEQYSDTRYYDYRIKAPDTFYVGHNVFQKYISEYSALDKGNNYIKYHSFIHFQVNTIKSWIYEWQWLYPSSFIDADWPVGQRYFTDQDVEDKIENTVQSGQIWVDNFVLTTNGVSICREGDFETMPSLAWNINQTHGSVITTNRVRQSYVPNVWVYTVVTSAPPRAYHAQGIGVDGGGGIVSSNTLRIASQVCGSGLGSTRLDFSIMAKGFRTLAGNNPMLGIYWEGYDSSGNILEKGKALNDATVDGKFWYVPLTNTFQNFDGYILLNYPDVDHIKIAIYNAFPLEKAPFGQGAKLMAAAYCFNGPYGHDETTNRFTFWNKITQSNETATTSKYMFLRDEMMTPGGKLYDTWGGGGTQWPLVIKKDGIAYDPDTGRITVNLRNMCAENALSAPIHVFRRAKDAGPAWNTNLYVKATPANIDNSLVSADRIAYVGLNSYSVPGPSASTTNPLTSGDNSLELTIAPTNPVANGQRIYVYIQDTESVKGWTAFNDLPECSGALQEGAPGQIRITINSADEDGIKNTELEYSINNQNIWHPLDDAGTNYLEAYYDLGATPPYAITFRARAVDAHDLSSNWIYLKYYTRHLDEIYVDPGSTNEIEMGTADAPFRSIQDAMDVAEPGIKVFRLKKGIYNENLVLKDGVELIGISPDLVRITGFVVLNSVSNVVIHNIMFTGTNGISLNSARNIQIKRCIFAVQNTAVEMTGNSQANIERITVGNAQLGILAKDNSALNITHSIITASNGITCSNSAVCVSTYNNVFCANQNYSGTSAGAACISINPLYTNIGDYSLKEQSPCWTAGYMQLSVGWQLINLVENSGFELGINGWYSSKNAVLTTTLESMTGKGLQVTMPGAAVYEGFYSSTRCQVEKGKTYTASAYVKGTGRGRIRICLYSACDGWTYANQTTELTWGWQKISVTKTITATNDSLHIMIYTWDAPQAISLYVDNVELVESKNYQMVYNGGFELGTNGWYSSKNAVLAATLESMTGKGLQVTMPGAAVYEGFYSSTRCQAEKGKTYTASAYVKGTGRGKVRIMLYSACDGWTYANQTTELTWGWQKISVTKTITATNDSLHIMIYTWDAPQAITLYVDNIELTEVKDYKMVYNGDFEMGINKWLTAKNAVLATTLESMSGKGLQVTMPGAAVYEGFYSSARYQVEKGKTYTASANVRSFSGGRVRICLYAESGEWTYANQTTELNGGWQKISVTKPIAATNESLYVMVYTWDAPQAITLNVDNVELKENNDVGCWKLDEGAGTTAHDFSWRGNNGTLQGNPQWTGGRINGALSFNGSNDYVDCGSNSSFKVSAITIEAWVYSPTANFAGYNGIAGAEGAYGCDIWNNRIAVHINTANQGWHWCQYSEPLTWDGWHHVAFTYDGVNTVKCYRDGVLILTDTTSSSGKLQWAAWATKLCVGQVNTGAWPSNFKGLIDEVRIYNRPLRDDEIKSDMQ